MGKADVVGAVLIKYQYHSFSLKIILHYIIRVNPCNPWLTLLTLSFYGHSEHSGHSLKIPGKFSCFKEIYRYINIINITKKSEPGSLL